MTRKAEYVRIEARSRFKRYLCRCSTCNSRATFTRRPSAMRRLPRFCERPRWRVDWNRQLRLDRTRHPPCWCQGRHYPHRPGSCEARPPP